MNAKEYLICPQCSGEEFTLKDDAVIEQEFKGESFQVKTPAMICKECGSVVLGTRQLAELRKNTADVYRQKHGLLTGEQIRQMRQDLEMNQQEFARLLKVGEASVKRWETWLVQEKGNDQLIRLQYEKAKSEKAFDWTPFVQRSQAWESNRYLSIGVGIESQRAPAPIDWQICYTAMNLSRSSSVPKGSPRAACINKDILTSS